MEISHFFTDADRYAKEDHIACSGQDEDHERYFGAVSAPIIQTSLFVQKNYQAYCDDMQHEAERFIYSRGLNPTVQMLEQKLAKLERGEACRWRRMGHHSPHPFYLSQSSINALMPAKYPSSVASKDSISRS